MKCTEHGIETDFADEWRLHMSTQWHIMNGYITVNGKKINVKGKHMKTHRIWDDKLQNFRITYELKEQIDLSKL